MARKKMKEEDKQQFQNVGLLKKDHDSLHGSAAIGINPKSSCRN